MKYDFDFMENIKFHVTFFANVDSHNSGAMRWSVKVAVRKMKISTIISAIGVSTATPVEKNT